MSFFASSMFRALLGTVATAIVATLASEMTSDAYRAFTRGDN